MRIDRGRAGFSTVELVGTLALAAITLLALLAVNDYFTRMTAGLEARAEMIEMRTILQTALAQKSTVPGGPSTRCAIHLLSSSGAKLHIPGFDPSNPAASNLPDPATPGAPVLEVSIYTGYGLSFHPVLESGKKHRTDQVLYKAYLMGEFRTRTFGANRNRFAGKIKIESVRNSTLASDLGKVDQRMATLTAYLPLSYDIDDNGDLVDCNARSDVRMIAQGTRTLDDCRSAGGVVINLDQGIFCRFDGPTLPVVMDCLPGWKGYPSPNVGCEVDPDEWPNGAQVTDVPDCPPATVANTTITKDPTWGSLFCSVDGPDPISGMIPPAHPDCPVVPGIDPDDYGPGETLPGWAPDTEPPQPSFDAASNVQRCRFNQPCTGGSFLKPGDPNGKPDTAVCRVPAPTDCPAWVPGGPRWVRMQPNFPLKCFIDNSLVPQMTAPQCPSGFFPVDPSIAGTFNDSQHVLCL